MGAPTKRVCAAEKDMGFKVLSLEICLEHGVFWTGSVRRIHVGDKTKLNRLSLSSVKTRN